MEYYEPSQLRHIDVPVYNRSLGNALYIACTTARALQYHPELTVRSDIADVDEYIVVDVRYCVTTKQVMYYCKRMAKDRPRWRFLPQIEVHIASIARPYWVTKRKWK